MTIFFIFPEVYHRNIFSLLLDVMIKLKQKLAAFAETSQDENEKSRRCVSFIFVCLLGCLVVQS